MNKYQMLPLPKDSAWDRPKSLWNKITSYFYNSHPKLYNVLDTYIFDAVDNIQVGLYNYRMWYKVIWNNRDWDYSHIYAILERKLFLQRKELVRANRYLNINRDNFYMTVALNLIDKVNNGHYEDEMCDYYESEISFDGNQIITETIWEKYDDYLSKYHNSVKQVKLKYPDVDFSDKFRLCLYTSAHIQEKAKSLLFHIINNQISHWFD